MSVNKDLVNSTSKARSAAFVWVSDRASMTKEVEWINDDVHAAFMAGAAWQADQPIYFPGIGGSGFIVGESEYRRLQGVDREAHTMRASLDSEKKRNAWLTSERDNARSECAKLTAARDAWEKTATKYAEDLHTARHERDDWHHAYDKLVSDVVHGRRHENASTVNVDGVGPVHPVQKIDNDELPGRLVPRGPFPGTAEATGGFTAMGATDESGQSAGFEQKGQSAAVHWGVDPAAGSDVSGCTLVTVLPDSPHTWRLLTFRDATWAINQDHPPIRVI